MGGGVWGGLENSKVFFFFFEPLPIGNPTFVHSNINKEYYVILKVRTDVTIFSTWCITRDTRCWFREHDSREEVVMLGR